MEKKDKTGLDDAVKNVKHPKKCQNKKIINIVDQQGELLKRFKESDGLFERVGLR